MKKSHFIIGLIFLLTCLSFTLGFEISYSDSGWDTSYDSGGFDYDYGGWSYDYDYNYGNNSSYSRWSGSSDLSNGESLLISLIMTFVLISIFHVNLSQNKVNKKSLAPSRTEHPEYYIDDIHNLSIYLPNVKLAQLKMAKILCQIFNHIQ